MQSFFNIQMNHQHHHNQNLNQSYENSNNNNRNQGQSIFEKKRQQNRKQVRREQMQEYFRAKRQLYFTSPIKRTLVECYQAIKSEYNLEQNICSLVNLLALPQPFTCYSHNNTNPTAQMIQKYCYDLVYLIFERTLPYHSNEPKLRQYCLNVLSNLFADPLCNNSRFVEIVVDTIDKRYGGLNAWDLDNQIKEVYFMISNLMRKNIMQCEMIAIQRLLAWAQAGILSIPSDHLKCLIQGLMRLFEDVNYHYNISNYTVIVDHFRHSRQTIIENIMKRIFETANPNNLQTKGQLYLDHDSIYIMFKFLNKNKPFVLKIFMEYENNQEDKHMREKFIAKSFELLGQQYLRSKTIQQIGNFLIQMLTYYELSSAKEEIQIDTNNSHIDEEKIQLNQMITIFNQQILTGYHLDRIIMNLSQHNLQCKLVYLKIIKQLFFNMQTSMEITEPQQGHNILETILVTKGLENIIGYLLQDMADKLRDVKILKTITKIYQIVIVIENGRGRLGQIMRQKYINLLKTNPTFICKELFGLIDALIDKHKQMMDQWQ